MARQQENSSNFDKKKTILFLTIALFLPVLAGVAFWSIGTIAYMHGLFYLPPKIIKISILILAPLPLIYLGLRKISRKIAGAVALVVVAGVLTNMVFHTTNETLKYEPVMKIGRNFSVPAGWDRAGEAPKYLFLGELWKKNDKNKLLTAEDMLKIAEENDIESDTLNCQPSQYNSSCTLTGTIDGKRIEVKYYSSPYEGEKSSLTLFVREKAPPESYNFKPYCGGQRDLLGQNFTPYPCSPLETVKHILIP